jgi:sugar phosphate isomerase/epimerase
MRDFSSSNEWLSINTATLRQQWTLPQIVDACARHGIPAISPWRDQVAACGLKVASRAIRESGLKLSGYCRGGMFPAADEAGLAAALADNYRAVDEACELGSPCLVLVVGSLPGALEGRATHRDIERARAQVVDGIARLLDHARPRKMPLAIEPLHPMYAADRACVNTLEQALDICDALDPANTGTLGVAVDLYHTWWDPKLQEQIRRAGSPRLLAFHVCDWLTPTTDLLLDRGMMGDGVIDIRKIRGWMEAAGYTGCSEVEIFSANNWWKRPGDEVLATCIERHKTVV